MPTLCACLPERHHQPNSLCIGCVTNLCAKPKTAVGRMMAADKKGGLVSWEVGGLTKCSDSCVGMV
jgi:hypothetical protein